MSDANPIEIWKPVKDWESLYEASNLGRIKGRKTGRILRPSGNGIGYLQVSLSCGPSTKKAYVHRLVLMAFFGPCSGKQANHKNHNKQDNRLENLEWVTPAENVRHSRLSLRRPSNMKLDERKVLEIRRRIRKGERQMDVARRFAVSPKLVQLVMQGKLWRRVPDCEAAIAKAVTG